MREKRTKRFPVMLTEQEASQIEKFRWDNRIPSQAEALRTLVERGLEATETETAGETAKSAPTA